MAMPQEEIRQVELLRHTLRDLFAATALQSLISRAPGINPITDRLYSLGDSVGRAIAANAYAMADLMLEEGGHAPNPSRPNRPS